MSNKGHRTRRHLDQTPHVVEGDQSVADTVKSTVEAAKVVAPVCHGFGGAGVMVWRP